MGLGTKLIDLVWNLTEKKDRKRIAAQAPPEGVETIVDIKYINDDNPMHLLDVYYPIGTNKKLPVIFDIHGGGWDYGTKELNKYFCMNLALEGFVVININYRLISEARFPAQLQDVFAALNWLEKRGDDYFADLNNVFVVGDSAGGHLASFTMALQNNQELCEKWNLKTEIKIKAGGLICGAFDLQPYIKHKNFLINAYGEKFLGKDFRKSEWLPKLSFSGVYNGKMPPLFLSSSAKDFIKNQTVNMIKFLQANNETVKYKIWDKNTKNKLIHVYQVIYPQYEESIITSKEMCAFFKEYID